MTPDAFSIRPALPEPIYQQIVAQLRRLIISGQLSAGEPLPSVREIAAHHAINPMTVSRAYGLLETDGLLERQRGKGMVVAVGRRRLQSDDRRLEQLQPQLRNIAQQARELDLPARTVLDRLRQLLEKKE
jgi:GntR family transcriptional regulator